MGPEGPARAAIWAHATFDGNVSYSVPVADLLSSPGDFDPLPDAVKVKKAGYYRVDYSVQFKHTSAATVSIGHGRNPWTSLTVNGVGREETRRYRPVFDVNVALVLTLRVLINAPVLSYSGVVHLEAGDEVGLGYEEAGPAQAPVPVTTSLTLERLS